MGLNGFIATIHNRTFKLGLINKFNDPFEGAVRWQFDGSQDEASELYKENLYNGYFEKGRTDRVKYPSYEIFKEDDVIVNDVISDYLTALEWSAAQHKLCEHYRYFCVSEKWDNILMWSHYSEEHKGFCISLKI